MKSILKAVMVMMAAPLLVSAQWDPAEFCRNFPPSPGECAIMSYYGIGTVINPGGIENELGDTAAIFFDDACNIRGGSDWEPQNPGFYFSFTLNSGNLVEARTACIGSSCNPTLGELQPTINGITPGFIQSSGISDIYIGLSVTWYRQTNFWCSV
jgi:hypothetical protein